MKALRLQNRLVGTLALFACLCAATTACKTKAERDAEIETQKEQQQADFNKSQADKAAADAASIEKKKLDNAREDYTRRRGYYLGVSGDYKGTYASFDPTYRPAIRIILRTSLPDENTNARPDTDSDYNTKTDSLTLTAEIHESRPDGTFMGSCTVTGLKPELSSGVIYVPCNTDDGSKRNYKIMMGSLPDKSREAVFINSSNISRELINGDIQSVDSLSVEIETTRGAALRGELTRLNSGE